MEATIIKSVPVESERTLQVKVKRPCMQRIRERVQRFTSFMKWNSNNQDGIPKYLFETPPAPNELTPDDIAGMLRG
jgi:hypothetical protein